MSRGGDFWSRRKALVQQEAEAESHAAEVAEAAAQDQEQAGKTDQELLEEFGLPDPDTLQAGDDFTAFMAGAVPDRLRRRALRRLWLSNPALANLDGLLDYGEDFTDNAKVIENLQTAYQVGKGMTRHVEEMLRQAADAAAPDAGESDEDEHGDEGDVVVLPQPAEEHEEPLAAEADPPAPAEAAPPETAGMAEALSVPRRRMRFTFDDHGRGAA